MYLIVGLGNPGKEYEGTRHNVGFVFAQKLANTLKAGEFALNKKLKSQITKTGDLIIAKPQTFMNLSGEAVSLLVKYYNVPNENIVVISDYCNLEVGEGRIRFSGSDGGHNGLKSIISALSSEFWRIRIGIGQNLNEPLESFVLKKIPKIDAKKIENIIDKTVALLIESTSEKKLENITIAREKNG
ncbi:MAG: aminoacyl-tRNA hydrolase [Candidatus Subteraquimicrobiales bacterium]|nr:aminoacyl-tRNA hydrolase [Candidatus Subteraquimicrobiales bacterium]